VHGEPRPPAQHDIQLLVARRARAELVVLLDELVARVRPERVHAERGDPELRPDRVPADAGDPRIHRRDLLDARHPRRDRHQGARASSGSDVPPSASAAAAATLRSALDSARTYACAAASMMSVDTPWPPADWPYSSKPSSCSADFSACRPECLPSTSEFASRPTVVASMIS